MSEYATQRVLAVIVSAGLLASLTVTAIAAPVSAAKPKCGGKTATILGTGKSEVIRGTAKADVIVARGGNDTIYGRGGNDIICGGAGNDRIVGATGNDLILGQLGLDKLFGGAGRDRLLGGPADDRLAGGPGNDACLQGSGMGLSLSCERPAVGLQTLAIAYSDMNGNHVFDTGDVLISRLVDTSGDNAPSAGDTIEMGKYPTSMTPTLGDFADWQVRSHTVASVSRATATSVTVFSTSGGRHTWRMRVAPPVDAYEETYVEGSDVYSGIADNSDEPLKITFYFNELSTDVGSPSQPATEIPFTQALGNGDDRFIDVGIYN